MDPIILLLALFLLGTLILFKSKVERQLGVLFVIRSNYGIRLIDWISKINPGFWNFIADFSVYLSFGGLGAYYLSRVDSRKHLEYSQIIFSSAFFFLLSKDFGLPAGLLSLVLFTVIAALLYARRNSILDFIFSSILLAVLGSFIISEPLILFLIALFGLPALLVFALISHSIDILLGSSNLPGVSPMLPTSQGGEVGVSFPGFDIFIPWWHALVAIIVTLVFHEAAHGILARVSKVRLKSTGILSLGALPIGAFVEPDDDELNSRSSLERMRVYSMGSFANLCVGVAAILLILSVSGFSYTLIQEHGVAVIGLSPGFPAEKVLSRGDVIYSIDNMSTDSLALFQNATSLFRSGQTVELNTSKGILSLVLAPSQANGSVGQMGVLVSKIKFPELVSPLYFLLEALVWIIFFNMNIALVNLLPVIPFDGGRMFKEVVDSMQLSELSVKRVFYGIASLTAIVFLVNAIPLFRIAINFFA